MFHLIPNVWREASMFVSFCALKSSISCCQLGSICSHKGSCGGGGPEDADCVGVEGPEGGAGGSWLICSRARQTACYGLFMYQSRISGHILPRQRPAQASGKGATNRQLVQHGYCEE